MSWGLNLNAFCGLPVSQFTNANQLRSISKKTKILMDFVVKTNTKPPLALPNCYLSISALKLVIAWSGHLTKSKFYHRQTCYSTHIKRLAGFIISRLTEIYAFNTPFSLVTKSHNFAYKAPFNLSQSLSKFTPHATVSSQPVTVRRIKTIPKRFLLLGWFIFVWSTTNCGNFSINCKATRWLTTQPLFV